MPVFAVSRVHYGMVGTLTAILLAELSDLLDVNVVVGVV